MRRRLLERTGGGQAVPAVNILHLRLNAGIREAWFALGFGSARTASWPILYLRTLYNQPRVANLINQRPVTDPQLLRRFSPVPMIGSQGVDNRVSFHFPDGIFRNFLQRHRVRCPASWCRQPRLASRRLSLR